MYNISVQFSAIKELELTKGCSLTAEEHNSLFLMPRMDYERKELMSLEPRFNCIHSENVAQHLEDFIARREQAKSNVLLYGAALQKYGHLEHNDRMMSTSFDDFRVLNKVVHGLIAQMRERGLMV